MNDVAAQSARRAEEALANAPLGRFTIQQFDEIVLGDTPPYLVRGLIPTKGLTIIWGPPKCGKSFWTFDLAMHVALGWEYRGHRVRQGAVVYVAAEGHAGFPARIEAFRQKHLNENASGIPFYLIMASIGLASDKDALVASIRDRLGDTLPALVVIDTLNRSIEGSENSDEDMTAYVDAADYVRLQLECAVAVVHHCGLEGTRPRGHTSLTGATDCQISVRKRESGIVTAETELMKDGAAETKITSRLEPLTVGMDSDKEPITSCVIVPVDASEAAAAEPEARLSKNAATMFSILKDAGAEGLTVDQWNEQAREAGLGGGRRSDLYDFRTVLRKRGLVHHAPTTGRWFANP